MLIKGKWQASFSWITVAKWVEEIKMGSENLGKNALASELEMTNHPQDFLGLSACPSNRGRSRSFWDFALSWWKPLTGGDWGIYGYQTSIIHDHRLWISTPHKNKPNFMFLQVSVLTKIVPSPDWFIGLSSVELCSNGAFVKSHTEEVMNQFPLFFLILL